MVAFDYVVGLDFFRRAAAPGARTWCAPVTMLRRLLDRARRAVRVSRALLVGCHAAIPLLRHIMTASPQCCCDGHASTTAAGATAGAPPLLLPLAAVSLTDALPHRALDYSCRNVRFSLPGLIPVAAASPCGAVFPTIRGTP